jgi:Putative zinc-finger
MVHDDSGAGIGCAVLRAELVLGYGRGELDSTAAWSVEAHLPGCPACREVLASCGPSGRLERNRGELLVRLGLPEARRAPMLPPRLRGQGHVSALLWGTPSLRASWLCGVLLVLAVTVGLARLAVASMAAGGPQSLGHAAGWTALIPFLFVAPLLPLAAVAAAFSPQLDPAFDLARAAPISGAWLLCVRSIAVIAVTLMPTVAAALLLPGPWWLAPALLLPALALCAAAVAGATVVSPISAAVGAALAWSVLVIVAGLAAGNPALVYSPAGQVAATAVVLAGVGLVAIRRNRIDLGWVR